MKVLTRSTFAGVGLGFLLLAACGCANGCATMGGGTGAKRTAYDGLKTTQIVLAAAQQLEILLVCDRPGAPPAGACVPKPLHDQIQGYFLLAEDYGGKLTAITRSLPKGTPTPGEAIDLALKLRALAWKILSALPEGPEAKELETKLAEA